MEGVIVEGSNHTFLRLSFISRLLLAHLEAIPVHVVEEDVLALACGTAALAEVDRHGL